MRRGLHQLVEAEFLYQQGLPPEATYLFKHALDPGGSLSVLAAEHAPQYHQRIAQVLEARFPESGATQPELLAHHYTEAGLAEPAIGYWQRAGQQASERSAHLEAVSHFTTGIELLKALPETPARTQHALTLYIALGAALRMAKGMGAPEVEQAYTQAYALCQQVGETPELVPVLFGLVGFYTGRAQFHTARGLGDTLLRLTQRDPKPHWRSTPTMRLGRHSYTLAHCLLPAYTWRRALPSTHQPSAGCDASHRRRQCGCWLRITAALTLWVLGYPAQALARQHDALTLAHALGPPHRLAQVRCWAAYVSSCRDVPAVHEQAEAAVALATEQGFPFWGAAGTILRGWALAIQDQGEAGMAEVRQGIAAYEPLGPLCSSHIIAPCWPTSLPTWAIYSIQEKDFARHKT